MVMLLDELSLVEINASARVDKVFTLRARTTEETRETTGKLDLGASLCAGVYSGLCSSQLPESCRSHGKATPPPRARA